MSNKPRVFIGSSTEYKKYAHAVHNFINNNYAYSKLWETSISPGEYTLPALYKTFHDYDFAIFIFSPDDVIKIRNRDYSIARDNVLFEFGMFLGINGLNNAFILAPEDYLDGGRIPSDLYGITISTFDSRRGDDELKDAVSSNCLMLLDKMKAVMNNKSEVKSDSENLFFNILSYEGELFSYLIDMISNAKKKVTFIITNAERRIVFDLLITIVYARINKIEIDVHYFPLVQTDVVSYSIEMFMQLGCNVKTYPIGIAPNSVAFVSDGQDTDYAKMIIRTDQYNRKNVYGYFYHGSIHYPTIKSFLQGFEDLGIKNKFIPKITKVKQSDLEAAFKKVPLFKQNNCTISLEEILPSKTKPQSGNLVREYKMKQILLLEALYNEYKFDYYEPTAITLQNKVKHLIVPPILEEHEGQLIIAEGHTRFFMHRERSKTIKCIVVKGMKLGLPSEPTTWDKVDIAAYGVSRNFIANEYYLQRIRKYEKYLHKGDWYSHIKDFN